MRYKYRRISADTWKTILTVTAPVISVIVVALITRDTNLRLSRLEASHRQATLQLEQEKLAEQRAARDANATAERNRVEREQAQRRQAFLEAHLPKILSSNSMDAKLGTTLLVLVLRDEADDILKRIESNSEPVVAARKAAEQIRISTGAWSIVTSGDKTLDAATQRVAVLTQIGYSPITIYKRNGFYRVLVGSYDRRALAEQTSAALRVQTRTDAYVVGLKKWCEGATSANEAGVELTVCLPTTE